MQILMALTVLLVGLVFLGVVAGNLNYERDRRRRGVVTEGVIVDSAWDINSVEAIYQAPVVEYVDQQGVTQRFQQRSGTTFKPPVGSRVEVWYDPAAPGEGPQIHEDKPMGVIRVVFAGAGLAAVAVGVLLLVRAF